MAHHFLSILDLDSASARQILERALSMKQEDFRSDLLAGKTLALIFEKSSTRTRVSFEVGINHLGGTTLFMTPADSQLGRSEPLKDAARVLSRYVSGLVVRTFAQKTLEELKEYGSIPVVNALSDLTHPCQVMSDMLTMYERTPDLASLKVAWVGDGNNMAHSWINAATRFPFALSLATPKGYEPDQAIVDAALAQGAKITLCHDPKEAVAGAHYVNTDVWASMGQETEKQQRAEAFKGFQVNQELLAGADSSAKVMHCLPAYRGLEITDQVMESQASIVWDQAENRLHMQKAILEWIFTSNK